MRSTDRFTTPDGALTFVVTREDGDITLGFEGFPWHTHGDLLIDPEPADGGPRTPEAAVRRFVAALRADRLVLALSSVEGSLRDVWISADPDREFRREEATGEAIELRYWSGAPWRGAE